MSVEVKVPPAGESITEVEIGTWAKAEGDPVALDEVLVVIETDKASMELPAPAAGKLGKILKQKGEAARVGDVIAYLEVGDGKATKKAEPKAAKPAPAAPPAAEAKAPPATGEPRVMPSAKRVLEEKGIDAATVTGTGPGGRVLKEDALKAMEQVGGQAPAEPTPKPPPAAAPEAPREARAPVSEVTGSREEEVVPMSRLRKVIARRLVDAQKNAAILTTFNEVDMTSVNELRGQFKDLFVEKYGVKLGLMSFFVKAAVDALRQFPAINAEIRGDDIIYRNYFDIGIAVGGGRGLVVPVLRNAEGMSFAQIEQAIADFARRAQSNQLRLDELQGGTFSISNGGVYGSLMSTPIINPPQSGILGLHAIQKRPVVVNDEIKIRPMMYVALSYDHRLVDGRESVTFLKRIKDAMENPARLMLGV